MSRTVVIEQHRLSFHLGILRSYIVPECSTGPLSIEICWWYIYVIKTLLLLSFTNQNQKHLYHPLIALGHSPCCL
jgi:hypothetical protein